MTFTFKPGARYRMPVVFGPAPGPRQKIDGTMWKPEETGTMNGQLMTLPFRTHAAHIERHLPPGFVLRGEPIVKVQFGWLKDLYWLAGRGYGILSVEFPVTYTGKTETISGHMCAVLWEGRPDAIMTGREELGFPKMFAEMTEIDFNEAAGSASCSASWMDYKFFDIELSGLKEQVVSAPGPGGNPINTGPEDVSLFYKYMPRTSIGGSEGADLTYVTTDAPIPGSTPPPPLPPGLPPLQSRQWTGRGTMNWHRASFEQLPLSYHVINGLADIEVLELLDARYRRFSGPGILISVDSTLRAVEG